MSESPGRQDAPGSGPPPRRDAPGSEPPPRRDASGSESPGRPDAPGSESPARPDVPASEPPWRGRALVHPWALLAAGALAFNVLWLRRRHPGLVSGKLSDVAINFLLPLFLAAVVEWLLLLGRSLGAQRWPATLGRRGIVGVCAVSAVYFTLLKAWPGFTPVHRALLGVLAAPLGSVWKFRNIADPTDLVALGMVPLAGWHLRACAARAADRWRIRRPSASPACRAARRSGWP